MTTPTGWEGIFEQGETIQWQGQPGTGIRWRDLLSAQTFMGAFFCIFSAIWLRGVFWMAEGAPPGFGGGLLTIFPIFGALFFSVGLYMLGGRLIWDAYQRRTTWYTLTNKAAYIAKTTLGRKSLNRYRRADMTDPRLEGDNPGDVYFAREMRQYQAGRRSRNGMPSTRRTQTYYVPIGFRQIQDPQSVYRLLVDSRFNDDTDHDAEE